MFDAWYTKRKDEVAAAVHAAVSAMESDQWQRIDDVRLHASLYDNREYASLDPMGYNAAPRPLDSSLTYNVGKSLCDTITSRIAKNKPLPKFLTSDGSHSDQQRAKGLNRFIEGQFDALRAYERARVAFLDACRFGTGLLKLQQAGGDVRIDRVLPCDVFVPAAEAFYGAPRQMHHRFPIHHEVLASLFPRRKDRILREAERSADAMGMVRAIESWRLPTSRGAKDGRRTICISDTCLLDEAWEHDSFPFAVLHWDAPTVGFWGTGLVASVRSLQACLNEQVMLVMESSRLTARPIVKKKRTAKLSSEKFAPADGLKVFDVDDMSDFEFVTTDAVPPSALQLRDEFWDKAFRLPGISQLTSQAHKPPGLDSGAAQREFIDIESDRHAVIQQQYEEFVLDVGRHLIRLAREAHTQGHDMSVRVPGKKFIQTIRWSEVDLDDSRYVMQLFSVSHLPRTPSGRLAYVQELTKEGLIDRKQALRVLDFPDFEQVTTLQNALADDIYRTIDEFLSGKEYEPPDPMQDLETGIRLMQMAYLENRRSAPDEALEKIRVWIEDAVALLATTQPTQGGPGVVDPAAMDTQGQGPVAAPTGLGSIGAPGVGAGGPAGMMQ